MSRQAVIHDEAILPVKAMVWVEDWDGELGVAIYERVGILLREEGRPCK